MISGLPRFALAWGIGALVGLAALAVQPARAALLHEALGPFERLEPQPYAPEDAPVFEEFGFEEGEEAEYRAPDGRSVRVRALQFYDDTGAFAAYSWLRPVDAAEVARGERAVESGDLTLIHFANYVVTLQGALPDEEDIEIALAYLPRPKPSADPPVLQHIPAEFLVGNSGRYILGPASLERLAPQLSPAVVGFHFGTEGHFGRYAMPDGEVSMVVLDYPSNPIARGQIEAFHGLDKDKAVAKQDGPLIAVALEPASPDAAQRLLARVRYRAEVTQHVEEPKRYDSLRNIVLDAFLLCGLLALLMVMGGLLVAVGRRLAGKIAPDSILAPPQGANMQQLNIDNPGQDDRTRKRETPKPK